MTGSLVVAVACDGRIIVGAEDGAVRVWDAEGRSVLTRFHAHAGPVRCMVLTTGDHEVITGGDSEIRAFVLGTGAERATFVNHTGKSFSAGRAMVLRDGGQRILTGSEGGIGAREWVIDRGRLKTVHFVESCEASAHTAVAADATGDRIFVGDSDGKVYIFKLNPYELERVLDIGDREGVGALAATPDGTEIYVLGAGDGVVGIVDPSGGDHGTFETGGERVRALTLSSDAATLVTGGEQGTVAIWDRATRSVRTKARGHGDAVCSVAFSSDDRHLVSAGRDGTVRSWNVLTGEAGASVECAQHDDEDGTA